MGCIRQCFLSFLNSVMIVSDLICLGFFIFAISILGFLNAFQSILVYVPMQYFLQKPLGSLGKEFFRAFLKVILPLLFIFWLFSNAGLSDSELQENLKLHNFGYSFKTISEIFGR